MESISVMLVDDNPTFLRIVERFLHEHGGMTVVGKAGDSHSAVERLEHLRPQVVLLDLGMPGVNGLETIPLLRAVMPEVLIIVLTLLDTEGYRNAASQAGADGFVSKSALNLDLIATIQELVQKAPEGAGSPNGGAP